MQSQSIHLTNDAIQKYQPDYGKYEKGNKLSYEQLDNYIKKNYEGKDFYHDVYPEMKVSIILCRIGLLILSGLVLTILTLIGWRTTSRSLDWIS